MVRKPGSMYRKVEGQPYCRREYMGGVPHSKIVQFNAGNLKMNFPLRLTLMVEEACQIRDSALEASRIAAVRLLEKELPNNFKLKMLKYPNNVLREHKMAIGAGADRVSDGMRAAFGKPVSIAVRANINEKIIRLDIPTDKIELGKKALKKAASKLPSPCRIIAENLQKA